MYHTIHHITPYYPILSHFLFLPSSPYFSSLLHTIDHLEPRHLIMPPPPRQPIPPTIISMPIMHECACDAARATVEVLVGAPAGKVDVPGVEGEGDVADGVGKIKANNAAL